MATWAGAHTNLRFELNLDCVTDGRNIYGRSRTETALKLYSPSDDSLTTISDDIVKGSTVLRWFRGNLYAMTHDEPTSVYVYRWNGGQNWSLVHTVTSLMIQSADAEIDPPANIGGEALVINGSYMVLVVEYTWQDADTMEILNGEYVSYSVNGADWVQGAISGLPASGISFSADSPLAYHAGKGVGIIVYEEGQNDAYYEFVGGTFQQRADEPASLVFWLSDKQYFWRRDTPLPQGAPLEDNVAFSTDLTNWTATTIHIVPVPTNCLAPIGYGVDTTLNQIDLYLWDGSDWVLSPSDTAGVAGTVVDFGNNHVHNFIRLQDGTCFAFVTVDSSVDDGFWKVRSDPLGGPGRPPEEQPYAAARFYSGEESLIERSQLPFSEVGPGGLDVRGDRVAVVGNHQPGQPVVALASADADFSDWLDHSGSLPTDGKVTSLRWVIPGTLTDAESYIIS